MARIRSIKPEFWQDEKLAPLPPLDRLVFLGLISQADDAGRLVDSVRLLDGLLFPMTNDSCGKSLETLQRIGRILRYTSASGQRLIQIVGWERHQKVQNPSAYVLPAPTDTESSVNPSETLHKVSGSYPLSPIPSLLSPIVDQAVADAPPPAKEKKSKRRSGGWYTVPAEWKGPTDIHRKRAREFGVDVAVEEELYRNYEFEKKHYDADRGFTRWLLNAKKFQGNKPPAGSEASQVREELPQSNAPRSGPPPTSLDEIRRQQREDDERADAWCRQHPEEARAISDDIALEFGPRLRGARESVARETLLAELRKRVREQRLTPKAVA